MTREVMTLLPRDEAHWLSLREPNLNSTDMAALFGVSPYLTAFELWHRKKGNLASDFQENERMRWGNRLESAVALGIAEDQEWIVEPFKEYIAVTSERVGSSFDYRVMEENGAGDPYPAAILEIKCVDFFAFKDGWIIDGDDIEAPPHIEIQVQHQMYVSGIDRAHIGVLVGGNDVRILDRQADPKIHALIKQKAAAFWKSINEGIAPTPDYSTDAKTVIALNQRTEEGKVLFADNDADLTSLISEYHRIGKEASDLAEIRDGIKAQIMERIGEAEKVVAGRFTVSAEQVGETRVEAFTRKAYRNFRVTAKKEKAA